MTGMATITLDIDTAESIMQRLYAAANIMTLQRQEVIAKGCRMDAGLLCDLIAESGVNAEGDTDDAAPEGVLNVQVVGDFADVLLSILDSYVSAATILGRRDVADRVHDATALFAEAVAQAKAKAS